MLLTIPIKAEPGEIFDIRGENWTVIRVLGTYDRIDGKGFWTYEIVRTVEHMNMIERKLPVLKVDDLICQ